MSLILRQSTAVVVAFGPFLDKTDGVTLETGLVTAIDHVTTGIFLSKNGSDAAVRNGTPTASVLDDYGMYRITLNTTDTNTVGSLRASFSEAATCLPVWQDFIVVEEAVYDQFYAASAAGALQPATAGRTLGVDANGLADANVVKLGPTGSGTAQTARDLGLAIPAAVAGAAGGLFIAGTNAATTVTTALTTTFTGNLTGSVGSVTGAVGSLTTNNDKTGYELSSAGVTAIWAEVVDGTRTAVQAMRGFIAALLGKASGLATTTAVYRNVGDTKDVITATVDENGNRSAITLDLT